MLRRPSVRASVTTLAAAGILVGGANLATYAATGHPLILGHANSAGTTTGLKNLGRGPALSLNSSKHSPPLTVNSSKMVKHLNADKLDGLNGAQLQTTAYRYAVPTSGPYTTALVSFPGLPHGRWMASYSIITTNAGAGPQCFFRQAAPVTAEALSWAVNAGGFSGNNANGLVDTRGAHGPVKMTCQGASFSFYSQEGDAESVVTFTNVDRVSSHSITTARSAQTHRGATASR
jgi:hypothetical protein